MAKIGVLGSGEVGGSLAKGFLEAGHEVMRGSREPSKLSKWKEGAGPKASIGTFKEAAAFGESIVLAVKGAAAGAAIDDAGPQSFAGKTVMDTTNPIAEAPPQNGVLRFFTDLNESLMEKLQKKVPAAHFVKVFNIVGAAAMVHPKFPGGPPTMFICGNDKGAKAEVTKILDGFGWETWDMGTAEAARAIEPLSILWCIPGFIQSDWNHAFKLLKAK